MKIHHSILLFIALIAFNDALGQDEKNVPIWRFNLIYGQPLIVKVEILNRDKAKQVDIQLHTEPGSVSMSILQLKIVDVIYATPLVRFDGRFDEFGIKHGEVAPFVINVLFRGDLKALEDVKNGIAILTSDVVFGRYLMDPAYQVDSMSDIVESLEERGRLQKVWESAIIESLRVRK